MRMKSFVVYSALALTTMAVLCPQIFASQSVMIHWGQAYFDPLREPPAQPVNQIDKNKTAVEEIAYYIVQFDAPIKPQWRIAIENTGAEIFDYVPDFAYIIRITAARLSTIRGLPHVRWVGLFQPNYRISPKAATMAYTEAGHEAAEPVALHVNLFPGVDGAAVQNSIQSMGGQVEANTGKAPTTILSIIIPANAISKLTAIKGIKWIEPAPNWKLCNEVATDIANIRTPRDTYGLYGEGQIVAIADTGIDQGSADPASLHDDFEDGNGTSRIIQIIDYSNDSPSDPDGHGTHNAGVIAGNGVRSGSNPNANNFPATSHTGMAPKASLVVQALYENGYLDIPPDITDLFIDARGAGADIHTNSWGVQNNNFYGSYPIASERVDKYMWDHKDFLILFPAGNEGRDKDGDGIVDHYNVIPPGSAKNCLTVGASEGDRPTGAGRDILWSAWPVVDSRDHPFFPVDPLNSDHVSDNDRGMAAFSSRGPTWDGRHKPDLVAPGTNILSTRSAVGGTGWGAYDSDYIWLGGTSSATAMVAGSAALMREYLQTQKGFDPPSAALIKAALLNSAEDISPGQYPLAAQEIPDAPVPNNVEGWGRLNLGDGVFPTAPFNTLYYDRSRSLDTGDFQSYTLYVTETGAPLRVNLVWTDYPGSSAVHGGLVNDLDIQISDPDDTIFYADNASQKAGITTLKYDANEPTSELRGSSKYATRFTPDDYPIIIDAVSIFGENFAPGEDYKIVIYDDNGGVPGTELYSVNLPYFPVSANKTIPIEGVQIDSGEFFVVLEVTDVDKQGLAGVAGSAGRQLLFREGSWQPSTDGWHLRANVRSPNLSTSFDRVNNTLGMTIDAPKIGPYTIRVDGYNIPRGPQPYALVASGNVTDKYPGTLQFSAATYSVQEDGGTATITVSRTEGTQGDISVEVVSTDAGTALAGSDYTAVNTTVNLADGADSQTFTVSILDDSSDEPDETVVLTLSNPTGASTLGAPITATLTIVDQDEEPGGGGGGGGGGGCFLSSLRAH